LDRVRQNGPMDNSGPGCPNYHFIRSRIAISQSSVVGYSQNAARDRTD